MATWDDILEQNRKYSETEHKPQPYLSELTGPLPPYMIFSCIDPRVPVEKFLGIQTAEAIIVRNAGGRIKNNINDLVFFDTFSQGQTLKNIIIIHHTDCGYTHNSDEAIKATLKASNPQHAHDIDRLYFGTYGSGDRLEESVREDLRFLSAQPLIRQELIDNAKGYIYDIKTGKLTQIPLEGRTAL
ncbi:carbonic anhydrase [Hyaloscypha bicolor E]|uniref:Carbonic anhydrase n=1 Tax=Hyaloscypha bicolor E TaxID=1095630 RepID=A0A2J6TPQ9_9HELO|nr:carbonic anhydrase [Hyaloscypha bicolor E]PMD65000.1 carbonic anhydrase [Hyaloscypha bicolor E]